MVGTRRVDSENQDILRLSFAMIVAKHANFNRCLREAANAIIKDRMALKRPESSDNLTNNLRRPAP
jgi:hypothetical protein